MNYIPNQPIQPDLKIHNVYWGQPHSKNNSFCNNNKVFQEQKTDEFFHIQEIKPEEELNIKNKSLLIILYEFILYLFSELAKLFGIEIKK
ncbi:MAG: hypothetical protein WCK67_10650 [bacterium]